MPTEEQIHRWEVLEWLAKRGDEHNYLVNRTPLDRDHEQWLQTRDHDTSRFTGAFANRAESETSVRTNLANELASIGPEDWAKTIPPDNGTILVGRLISVPATFTFVFWSLTFSQLEKKYSYINVHSTSDGQWYGVIATHDTGSDENWISQEVVDRLRLEVTKGLVTRWKTFSGETAVSDSTVRATWCNSGTGISYANVFRVIPNAPFDVLFGRNLLFSGEVSFYTEELKPGSVLIIIPPQKENGEDATIQANQIKVDQAFDKTSLQYTNVKGDGSDSSEGQAGQGKQGGSQHDTTSDHSPSSLQDASSQYPSRGNYQGNK
jgi:hypothetical protein